MMKRKTRTDRNHAIYVITNTVTAEQYVGVTVCSGNVKKALKVRMQKHVRRALTENKDWGLSRALRERGADRFVFGKLEVIRGKRPAHAHETELINTLKPALNTFGVK